MSQFDLCLPYILREECPFPEDWSNPANFSHDRFDRGGPTMCGITQREWDHWCSIHEMPHTPVRQLDKVDGVEMYRVLFWAPHCDSLPVGLDLSFFDSAVNQGVTEAVRILQVALDLKNDGIWGPKTTAAVSSSSAAAVVKSFWRRRKVVYHETREFSHFGHAWLGRADRIERASLEMIGG